MLYVIAEGGPYHAAGRHSLVGIQISILMLGSARGLLHVMSTEQCVTVERCTPAAGDWMCNSCGQHNFRSRAECYKCAAPKCGPLLWLCSGCAAGVQLICELSTMRLPVSVSNACCSVAVRAAPGGSQSPLLQVLA